MVTIILINSKLTEKISTLPQLAIWLSRTRREAKLRISKETLKPETVQTNKKKEKIQFNKH